MAIPSPVDLSQYADEQLGARVGLAYTSRLDGCSHAYGISYVQFNGSAEKIPGLQRPNVVDATIDQHQARAFLQRRPGTQQPASGDPAGLQSNFASPATQSPRAQAR